MQTNNTIEAPGLKVTPIGWAQRREILRQKFDAGATTPNGSAGCGSE